MAPTTVSITFIHPWSESKGERIKTLLTPNSSITNGASLLLTPSTRPKAPSQPLTTTAPKPASSSSKTPLLLASLTIPASPLLSTASKAAKEESLLGPAGVEETKWDVKGGYVVRSGEGAKKAGTVMLARFLCKDEGGAKGKVVERLSKYAAWVKDNEPKTLTYAVLVRNDGKGGAEVLMFERYTGPEAVGEHSAKKEFKAMFKEIMAHIEMKQTRIAEWAEEAGSVGEGLAEGGKAKL